MVRQISRLPRVMTVSGHSRSTIYEKIRKGLWPKPIPIGMRSVGWPEDEIAAVNDAVIGGASQDDIRRLVSRLEAARKRLAAEMA
jgi:prophage regulatory protein